MTRTQFLIVSRSFYRASDWFCNHATRILEKGRILAHPKVREQIEALNQERIELQEELNRIGNSHGHVCAECKGHCCGAVRERDCFIDRVLQDPETTHRNARRKGTDETFPETFEECPETREAEWNAGHCRMLTTRGCRIPFHLRPIQCTAYYCSKGIAALSIEECKIGINTINALMDVQWKTVKLAWRSRKLK